MRRLGLPDAQAALNQKLLSYGDTFNIVGVADNYRHQSPKTSYEALLFWYFKNPWGHYSIRLKEDVSSDLLDRVSAYWESAYQDKPLEYFFLKEHYEAQYSAEQKLESIMWLFNGLSILVACLGLFGLASFMTRIRLKELSIRKVIGANSVQLWLLLTSDFMKLVFGSMIAAVPLFYFGSVEWLAQFELQMTLGLLMFIVPSGVVELLSLAILSYRILKALRQNPTRCLRTEV